MSIYKKQQTHITRCHSLQNWMQIMKLWLLVTSLTIRNFSISWTLNMSTGRSQRQCWCFGEEKGLLFLLRIEPQLSRFVNSSQFVIWNQYSLQYVTTKQAQFYVVSVSSFPQDSELVAVSTSHCAVVSAGNVNIVHMIMTTNHERFFTLWSPNTCI
jgi:hypothetical protein